MSALHGPTSRVERPRNTKPVIPVLKIGARDRYAFAVCSDRVHGRTLHWDGQRTRACSAEWETCRYCQTQCPKRDKGFILVANTVGQVRGFLELTPLAWVELLTLRDTGGPLRGLCIEVRRLNNSDKGRLVVEVLGRYTGEQALPPDKSPDETLSRILGGEN